jgi:hypothetical protein
MFRFLWVKLQVDFLCRKKTEQDILQALDMGLAGNLDQIYNDALNSILSLDSVAQRVGQQVISWLLFARRTLQPVTLFSILRLDPDMQLSEPEQVNIIDICHNLIMLDTDTNALSFCHSSVRDFMQQQEMFSLMVAHHLLATACLRQCTAGPCPFLLLTRNLPSGQPEALVLPFWSARTLVLLVNGLCGVRSQCGLHLVWPCILV